MRSLLSLLPWLVLLAIVSCCIAGGLKASDYCATQTGAYGTASSCATSSYGSTSWTSPAYQRTSSFDSQGNLHTFDGFGNLVRTVPAQRSQVDCHGNVRVVNPFGRVLRFIPARRTSEDCHGNLVTRDPWNRIVSFVPAADRTDSGSSYSSSSSY